MRAPHRHPSNVSDGIEPHRWSVRALGSRSGGCVVHARNHTFPVGSQASFAPTDTYPSAVEYLLGALAADLLAAFTRQAVRRRIIVDAAEALFSGHLHNPLMVVGVVGESGSPAFEAISGTLYVTTDAEEPDVQEAWHAAIATCPVIHTLRIAVPLDLQLQVIL
ncbi:MAG: OsmC family protein [Chloroflexi bacterium]|nr:OsmC family protein [Chloroflexota bacterium]